MSFHFSDQTGRGLAVCNERKQVVRLTEFRLSRGESASSITLSSSSKSVSDISLAYISVASDCGRGASAFVLKNWSLERSFWNISTREAIS